MSRLASTPGSLRLLAPALLLLAACSTDRLMNSQDTTSRTDISDPSPMVAEATFAAG